MPDIHDLRSYLDVLEAAGQLARISQRVSLDHELADVAAALERQGGPAPLFEHVDSSARGGDVFSWPIFSSAVANPARAALALGLRGAGGERGEVAAAMGRALDPANAVAPRRVERAAWEANVIRGEDVDLTRLPIPLHARGDGGPFITGGVTISKDPATGRAATGRAATGRAATGRAATGRAATGRAATGRGNLSFNRMQVQGPRELGFNVNEWRHVMQFLRFLEDRRPVEDRGLSANNGEHRERRDEGLPVAIAIGLDPAISIAAGARYEGDELCIAGALRGAGVAVRRGMTVDVDIPVEAEIVIEGRLGLHERRAEGALAEFHGYFGEIWPSPVLRVTAVCWRDEPIFQTIIPGWHEHVYLGNVLPREPLLLNFVRHVSRNVTGLHIPPYGSGFSAIVAIDKANPGEPKNVALAAMTAHVNIKWVIVVDPDVDIYDPADVLWALNTRVDWSRDIFLVPGAQGHEMDPTADTRGVQTKIGIDATFDKGRRDYAGRVRYAAIDLSRYLG